VELAVAAETGALVTEMARDPLAAATAAAATVTAEDRKTRSTLMKSQATVGNGCPMSHVKVATVNRLKSTGNTPTIQLIQARYIRTSQNS